MSCSSALQSSGSFAGTTTNFDAPTSVNATRRSARVNPSPDLGGMPLDDVDAFTDVVDGAEARQPSIAVATDSAKF